MGGILVDIAVFVRQQHQPAVRAEHNAARLPVQGHSAVCTTSRSRHTEALLWSANPFSFALHRDPYTEDRPDPDQTL